MIIVLICGARCNLWDGSDVMNGCFLSKYIYDRCEAPDMFYFFFSTDVC